MAVGAPYDKTKTINSNLVVEFDKCPYPWRLRSSPGELAAFVDLWWLEFWARIILLLCHLNVLKDVHLERSSMFMQKWDQIGQNQFTFSTLWNPLGSHSKVTLVPEKRWERSSRKLRDRTAWLTSFDLLKKLTWSDLVWRTWRTPSSPSSMMEPWSPPRGMESQRTGDQDKPQISSQYITIPNSKGHNDGWCRSGHHSVMNASRMTLPPSYSS